MNFNAGHYPYPSCRTSVYGKKGMVATTQPLAAQAGLDIIKAGGNAIDAAIATAACLTVVEPTSNGIGGDAFALIWCKGKLYGLNSSGPAPLSISLEAVKTLGYSEIPKHGWIPVTVPGAPAAWTALSERFGKLPFKKVLEPAIKYAEEGFPVSPIVSGYWRRAFEIYSNSLKGEEFKYWFETFAPKGRAPLAGELWNSQSHAETLIQIAETKADAFYKGKIAEKIDVFSRKYGGFLRKEDLESYKPLWVDPIKINYRGYDVWEIPPNGQGMIALMALNILRGFEFDYKDTTRTFHLQIEAMKLAFADGLHYITDRNKMQVTPEELLSSEYGEERRKLIKDNEAQIFSYGTPQKGGTVYLAAADGEGNMISYIQSNYMGFGSGLVVPGTGISLQNRGHNFSLNPENHNRLEGGKRTYHTIIPGFLSKDGSAIGPFGVMGGFMQPQGHVQVIMNTIDFNLNPQAALDAPRWQWLQGKTVELEGSIPPHIARELQEFGHKVTIPVDAGGFGRGQIIWKNEDDVLVGGTEARADGHIAAW